jgi:hypothetical protein
VDARLGIEHTQIVIARDDDLVVAIESTAILTS